MARPNALPALRTSDVTWESGVFGAGLRRETSPCLRAIPANKRSMRSTGGFRKSDEAEPKLRLIGCCGLGLVDVIVEGVPLRGSRVTQHVDVGSDGVAPHS